MNYAKVVGAALQLFPRKIKVTLVQAGSNEFIGTYKMDKESLPAFFNRPTILRVAGEDWQVLNAHPTAAGEYQVSRKLLLHVNRADALTVGNQRSFVPSLPFPTPVWEAVDDPETCLIRFRAYEWRQLEFLPVSSLPDITEEMNAVDALLRSSAGSNVLEGFSDVHIRTRIPGSLLSIDWEEFCSRLQVTATGIVGITADELCQPANGFAVQNNNYCYYGLRNGNRITDLCLPSFDCIDEELMQLLSAYGLVLADWCNASVYMESTTEEGESQEEETAFAG